MTQFELARLGYGLDKLAWQRRFRKTLAGVIKRAESRAENARKLRIFVRALKASTPCTDCRNKYPHYVMEFDHVRGVKRRKVSDSLGNSWSNAIIEIRKCDIVCANCHKIRTWVRMFREKGRRIVVSC